MEDELFRRKVFTVELQSVSDERGNLVIGESPEGLPFEVKRFFYMYSVDSNATRGEHANRKSKMFFVAVSGSCKVQVAYRNCSTEFCLTTRSKALFTDAMTWKKMYDFSSDCILLVFSDIVYDSSEYIRDYDEYLKEVNRE